MEYKFNPENYGYEHVSKYPELKYLFGECNAYIKVVCVGGNEFKPEGRLVYWYSACYSIGCQPDDRWEIKSNSYDSCKPDEFSPSRVNYSGLISTDSFAKQLLKHLFGTTKNSSVKTDGKERFESRINVHIDA